MELAGRKALLTGATGGLGRAIAEALAARGARRSLLSARKREALEELAAELPGEGHRVLPADLAEPGAAEQLAAEAGDGRRPRRQRRPAGRRAGSTTSAPRRSTRALRVNLEAPMLLARALYPAMLERGAGHLVFVSSLSGKAAEPAHLDLQRDQVRPARLRPRPARRPRPAGRRRLARLARLHPRRRDVRRRRRQAAAGHGHRDARAGRRAVVKAIERDKVEVAVAPLPAARAGPLRAGQPRHRGPRRRAARPARRPPKRSPTGTRQRSAEPRRVDRRLRRMER